MIFACAEALRCLSTFGQRLGGPARHGLLRDGCRVRSSKVSTLPRLRHWCLQRGGFLFTAG